VVDFSKLGGKALVVSSDRRSVTVRLPHAQIADVRVDPSRSQVLDRKRGVLDRIGSVFSENPTSERELYVLAEKRLRAAAAASGLQARADTNTRRMLTALFQSLGFDDVTVRFSPLPGT
jgi:hypothetical protein